MSVSLHKQTHGGSEYDFCLLLFSCPDEEHSRGRDGTGGRKWTDHEKEKKNKAQSQSTVQNKTKGDLLEPRDEWTSISRELQSPDVAC